MENIDDILQGLSVTASPAKRIEAFKRSGMSAGTIAEAIGVTTQTLRAWGNGKNTPRPSVQNAIDDLRSLMHTLIDQAGLEPEQASTLLASRPTAYEDPANLLEQQRPIDVMRQDPSTVFRYVGEIAARHVPQE